MPLDDMSLPNTIADVGLTLRQVLRDQIADLAPEGRIIFASPADAEVTTEPRLSLFLYQILEAAHMRNQPPQPDETGSERRLQTIELNYLVTPYTQQVEDAHRLLGRVMRAFLDHAILQGSVLQGSLADIAHELRLLLHPMTLEEMNRIWGVFPGKPYRLSVVYQVTPVRIFGSLETLSGRVITRELDYAHLIQGRGG